MHAPNGTGIFGLSCGGEFYDKNSVSKLPVNIDGKF